MEPSETVVILDDDPGTALFLRSSIRSLVSDWEVVVAQTPEDAIHILERNPISCLVTDLYMPLQNGIETARQVRELDERSGSFRYVLMLTCAQKEVKLESLEYANEFLSKPAEPKELVALLRNGLKISRRSAELLHRVDELGRMARTDPLTNLFNRRHCLDVLDRELERWFRTGDSFSILMLDIDHFKSVNDRFGHDAGDRILVEIANRIQQSIRPFDTLARWGGEEFLAILPHTRQVDAEAVAERLRLRVKPPVDLADGSIGVTMSIGVAAVDSGVQTREHLVDCADRALYRAKREGRDRIVGAHDFANPTTSNGSDPERRVP